MRTRKIMKYESSVKSIYNKKGYDITCHYIYCLYYQGWISAFGMHKLRAYLDTLAAESETEKGVEE